MSTIPGLTLLPYSQTTVPFKSLNPERAVRVYSNFDSRVFKKSFPSYFLYLNIEAPRKPGTFAYTVCVYSVDESRSRQLAFSIDHIPADGAHYMSQLPIQFPKRAVVTKVEHLIDESGQMSCRELEVKISTPPPCSP